MRQFNLVLTGTRKFLYQSSRFPCMSFEQSVFINDFELLLLLSFDFKIVKVIESVCPANVPVQLNECVNGCTN